MHFSHGVFIFVWVKAMNMSVLHTTLYSLHNVTICKISKARNGRCHG